MSDKQKDEDKSYFEELDELEAAAGGVLAVSPELADKLRQKEDVADNNQ